MGEIESPLGPIAKIFATLVSLLEKAGILEAIKNLLNKPLKKKAKKQWVSAIPRSVPEEEVTIFGKRSIDAFIRKISAKPGIYGVLGPYGYYKQRLSRHIALQGASKFEYVGYFDCNGEALPFERLCQTDSLKRQRLNHKRTDKVLYRLSDKYEDKRVLFVFSQLTSQCQFDQLACSMSIFIN
jgi:hypothetical protein